MGGVPKLTTLLQMLESTFGIETGISREVIIFLSQWGLIGNNCSLSDLSRSDGPSPVLNV